MFSKKSFFNDSGYLHLLAETYVPHARDKKNIVDGLLKAVRII